MFCPECYSEISNNTGICENCGCPVKNSIQKEKKILKERYEIISPLASGGMSEIFIGYDLHLKRLCVIKGHYKKGLDTLPSEIRERILKPFEQEAEMLANLRHSNLPCVTDYFIEKNTCYIIMDYIEGKDLEVILEESEDDGLPEKQVIEWSIQICRILEYLHNQKFPIIHGDIKPANIIVRQSDGWLMLVDFGSASFTTLKPDKEEKYGTQGYAAPEQYMGVQEIRSDIYSLGCTMYELKFISPGEIIPDLTSDIDRIVMKCLEFNIEDRFNNATVLKENLLAAYSKNFGRKDHNRKIISKVKTKKISGKEDNITQTIKVLIADDDIDMCNNYKETIEHLQGIEVIGIAHNGKEAVDIVLRQNKPDVILMDLHIPVMNGIKTTQKILSLLPSAKIIIVSDYVDEHELWDCFNNGASGYILKSDTSWDEIEKTIKKAFQGGFPVSSQVNLLVIKKLIAQKNLIYSLKEEETKKCLYCDRLNRSEAKYCNECGKNIFALPAEEENYKEDILEEIIYFNKEKEIDGDDLLKEIVLEDNEAIILPEKPVIPEKEKISFWDSPPPVRMKELKQEQKTPDRKFTLKKSQSDKAYCIKMPQKYLKKKDL